MPPLPAATPAAARASRVLRLLLVRHAPTAATRRAAFDAGEPVDARGLEAAAGLAGLLPVRAGALMSPALCCRQTAEAAGLAAEAEPALRGWDVGAWAGLDLAEVAARDPARAAAWRADPHAAPPGGETLAELSARVGAWLDGVGGAAPDGASGWLVAVTHAEVVRLAVLHALGAPLAAFWQLDVGPLSVTELHAQGGRWRVVRVNAAPGAAPGSAPGLA